MSQESAVRWSQLSLTMQIYCEPFFAAVDRWLTYTDEGLLQNRIQLLETAELLLHRYSHEQDVFVFDLNYSNRSAVLHDEVIPTAGKLFVTGNLPYLTFNYA